MPHHGEFTSCSLIYAYYKGNAGFPQNNLIAINQKLKQRKRVTRTRSFLYYVNSIVLLSLFDRLLGRGVQIFEQARNFFRGGSQDGKEGILHTAACTGPGGPGWFSLTILHEG